MTDQPAGAPQPIRVFLAEDEAIIRLDIKETLIEQGYEVVGETDVVGAGSRSAGPVVVESAPTNQ